MKKIHCLYILMLVIATGMAQPDILTQTRSIEEEGKRLYRSEMASWYGTDLLLEHTPDRSRVGGYFSYTENNLAKCIFFSNDEHPSVIGSILFDSSYNVKTAQMDFAERNFTQKEYELYMIRNLTLNIVSNDTMFKLYEDMNFNLIPLIDTAAKEKKVYILTGPKKNGLVVFGNDYLLRFNEQNKLLEKKQLHMNIIPIMFEAGSDTTEIVTMHSHMNETSDFITPTDVCTLMLYEQFTNWAGHNVISKDYVSIWNCHKNQLAILSRKSVKKILKSEEKRKRKKKE